MVALFTRWMIAASLIVSLSAPAKPVRFASHRHLSENHSWRQAGYESTERQLQLFNDLVYDRSIVKIHNGTMQANSIDSQHNAVKPCGHLAMHPAVLEGGAW